jgi:hypothetical protein
MTEILLINGVRVHEHEGSELICVDYRGSRIRRQIFFYPFWDILIGPR